MNSLVYTDQGKVQIYKINPKIHTINNKKIIAISKTISTDSFLIYFKAHSLGFNYPNKDIIISQYHKIFYRGKFIEAYKFIGKFKEVTKIKYTGEVLYNILMERYNMVIVNNLICETLHPNHFIAKLLKSKLSHDRKNILIYLLNNSISQNNFEIYKKIINFTKKI